MAKLSKVDLLVKTINESRNRKPTDRPTYGQIIDVVITCGGNQQEISDFWLRHKPKQWIDHSPYILMMSSYASKWINHLPEITPELVEYVPLLEYVAK